VPSFPPRMSRHVVGLGILIVLSLGSSENPVVAATSKAARSATGKGASLGARWGIEIKGVRLASAGYMLDFRYHVTDAEKAKPLFDRRNEAVLIDQESGAKMLVPVPPKTGALRSTRPPKAGRTYFMFFANPGQYIKPGKKVTVTIGEFKAEGLVVME